MIDTIDTFIRRHRRSGLLVDTNVLLLFMVGKCNVDRIGTFKNTQRYVPEDFYTASLIIESFDRLISTPHVLTEVSNLSNQLREPARSELLQVVATEVGMFCDERYVSSRDAMQSPAFLRLGLTDIGIATLSTQGVAVLTDDFPLYQHLIALDTPAINFSHLRPLAWN
jgi:hypothetical protein